MAFTWITWSIILIITALAFFSYMTFVSSKKRGRLVNRNTRLRGKTIVIRNDGLYQVQGGSRFLDGSATIIYDNNDKVNYEEGDIVPWNPGQAVADNRAPLWAERIAIDRLADTLAYADNKRLRITLKLANEKIRVLQSEINVLRSQKDKDQRAFVEMMSKTNSQYSQGAYPRPQH